MYIHELFKGAVGNKAADELRTLFMCCLFLFLFDSNSDSRRFLNVKMMDVIYLLPACDTLTNTERYRFIRV